MAGGYSIMAEYQGSQKWRPGWGDPRDVQTWIRRELSVGDTLLNVPCGESTIGDVRADVDPERNPDILVDLYNLPFEPRSFDTVYFDPPFDFMWQEGWQSLIEDVYLIADQRLIVKTPRRRVQVPKAEKSWRIVEPNPGSPQFQVWLFQIFDRLEPSLGAFGYSPSDGSQA
jgi:hypothetical protein